MPPSPIQKINELLESGRYDQFRTLIQLLKPVDAASLLENSPPKERTIIWELIGKDLQSEILQELNEEILEDLLSNVPESEILKLLEQVDSDDDLTDILQHLPDAITHQLLRSMDSTDRERVENLLAYPEDTAGGLMDTDTVSVRARVSLDVVLRYLRRHVELPETTDKLFVVNKLGQYMGILPLRLLLVSDPTLTVKEVMISDVDSIPADMSESEVAQLFSRYDLISAPVTDESGMLLGRITIDDVVDVIKDEAARSLLAQAGLTEDDDPFAPILRTARSRTIWLGANLLTAFLASAVINIFEDTIAKVVTLAVLMPIVASMGGVAGSQTLTLVIRNMAQGHLNDNNERWLMKRELAVGAINGVVWALVVAVAVTVIFRDTTLGIVISMALVINIVTAALAGATLPSILRKLDIDPAIAGTVLLTTITDVVGFFSFLGLATIFYG
ncbi:MAG: magnesium transporter [Pseudomonadales bacterium]|nr:magnesium transporter [Pseudomonadales bacterium]